MIKQLLNSLSQNILIHQSLADQLFDRRSMVIDLLAKDKSRYVAQPRPIIVNYLLFF